MDWKEVIRSRIASNVQKLTHLTEEQRQTLIEEETAAVVFCTEAGLPLMSAQELKARKGYPSRPPTPLENPSPESVEYNKGRIQEQLQYSPRSVRGNWATRLSRMAKEENPEGTGQDLSAQLGCKTTAP